MTRISGLEKKQAPWHLRWFYSAMRKMFGRTDSRKTTDARSGNWRQHRDGSGHGAEARVAAPFSLPKCVLRGESVVVLSRHQFCRWQKSWTHR
jgi:hypothetical protein